jgi:SAM-dependent methyltransferase
LPLKPASFDLILVVHFVAEGLVELLRPLLRPGGYLVIETFAGQRGQLEGAAAAGRDAPAA